MLRPKTLLLPLDISTYCSFLCLVVMAIALAGCGKKSSEPVISVKGRLTLNGEPLKVERADVGLGAVRLQFWPVADGAQAIPIETTANADGHYEVLGREGFGIRPGKYKIAVFQFDPYPQVDRLKGKFDVSKTPIERDISGPEGSEVVIDIELSKPTG